MANFDIKSVARLSRLKLTPSEEKMFENQLSDILNHVEKLNQLDTKNTQPTINTTGLQNTNREDKILPSEIESPTKALREARNQYNNYFKVSAVLDKEAL